MIKTLFFFPQNMRNLKDFFQKNPLFKSLHAPCFGLPSDEILPQKKPQYHIHIYWYCNKDPIQGPYPPHDDRNGKLWKGLSLDPLLLYHWPLVPNIGLGTKHWSWTQYLARAWLVWKLFKRISIWVLDPIASKAMLVWKLLKRIPIPRRLGLEPDSGNAKIPQKYAISGPAEKSISSSPLSTYQTHTWFVPFMTLLLWNFHKQKKCGVHPKKTCDSKSNSMGLDRGGVKKTWLDSTRLSLEVLCFKLSNSVFFFPDKTVKFYVGVSKSLIEITKPWKEGRKEGRRASNWASKLFTHTTRKHPKSLWGQKLDQSPNLISFFFL